MECVWDGGGLLIGGVALWGGDVNWVGDAASADGDDVRFGLGFGSGTRINAAGNRTVGRIAIDTATGFSLENFAGAGDTITLNSGDVVRTAPSSGPAASTLSGATAPS